MTIAPYVPLPEPPGQMRFQAEVMRAVAGGWRVESMTPALVVLVSGYPCNHILHALLTMFTCGFWAPIWIILAFGQKELRVTGTLLPDGRTFWTQPS